MNVYTARGSAALDARIAADMERIAEAAAPHSLAGILIGGYGRGEGTPFIRPDGSQSPFNDYDLVVVVGRLNGRVREKFRMLEKQLSRELDLPVDLCPYGAAHLRRCAFSLLNYEMKYGHKVIWGDREILSAMPAYPSDAIPLSEGTRLLLNRGKLLVDMRQRLADPAPLSEAERVCFIKFIHKVLLAFGDCALLAAGRYDVAYAVKKVRYTDIGHCPDRPYVVNGYLRAIELKDWGDYGALKSFDIEQALDEVSAVFLRFMPWYRARYTEREGTALKNLLLNLKWNRRISMTHPREQLYDAVTDLLRNESAMPVERFYQLQRRFS